MIKQNKWKLIIGSIVILLPAVFGIIMWDVLPEQMAVHWGITGEADGYAPAIVAITVLPLILLAIYWIGMIITAKDFAKNQQNKKVLNIIFWIVPVISVYVSGIFYASAFGLDFNMSDVTLILLGIVFIVIGNYLPKSRQNRTFGIKIKWTLANEENWNKTHRVGGIVGVISGVVALIAAFLPSVVFPFVAIAIIIANVGITGLYSYLYYKKQVREGIATKEDYKKPISPSNKVATVIVLVIVAIIVVFALIVSFSGEIEVDCDEAAFTVEASFYGDITVKYDDIDSIEYRENDDPGQRVAGFGSAKLLMGQFKNEEFGSYTRYSYTKCDACIVLTLKDRVIVISGEDAYDTKDIYEDILDNMVE